MSLFRLFANLSLPTTVVDEAGTPFSRSRPWFELAAFCSFPRLIFDPPFALFKRAADMSACFRFSMGEKVIFFGVSGVVTAFTAFVTLRADLRSPSLIFHCLFFARKNKTAVVTAISE